MSYPVYPKTYKRDITLGDKTITIEVGKFAQQADAAVLLTCGETVVHTTIGLGRKVNLGYFPLSVEFTEKLNAAGIIKGSRWVKRPGRPLDKEILKARVIDRSLRPLFPAGITNEVQVINTVFSFDGENNPDMLGLLGSALGLAISSIPFDGPMAGLKLGYNKEDKTFTFNPTITQQETCGDLDLIVSGSGDAIVMVEAGANEISEPVMIEALVKAQEELGKVCTAINEIVAEIGKDKVELISEDDAAAQAEIKTLADTIFSTFKKETRAAVVKKATLEAAGVSELEEVVLAKVNEGRGEDELYTAGQVSEAMDKALKTAARSFIFEDGSRPDGRATDEIRDIWSEVDVFPRTHGSAMFKRGATQGVTVVTLGNPSLGQLIESIEGEATSHYFHHYSSPPYSFGSTGRFGFAKRREIGHGALAERALMPVIPSQEDFPYTIHVLTEIMSSNGSTSQASVCGSTLSLMAAGVPIKRPVSGIAMGLMSDGKQFIVLSDIQGLEDHVGDMDFKVSGTTEGITAIQMDIKLKGIPRPVLEQALEQARVGRIHIMDEMMKALPEKRTTLSEYAPKVVQITIPAKRIGELIGPGGKIIKGIIEQTGADINVEEDNENELGIVNISSSDQAQIDAAHNIITNMMRVVEPGEAFDGTVTRVEGYGAFVEYLPGREGLVHVSAMSTEYVQDASEMVKVGDSVHVRIAEIKDDGKIGLTMLTEEQEAEAKEKRAQSRGGDRNGGGNGGGRPRFNGGRDRRGGGGGYRGGDRGGRR